MRTGTAAASVIGSGIIRRAVPSAKSFFAGLLLCFTTSFSFLFVSESEGGFVRSERSFVAS